MYRNQYLITANDINSINITTKAYFCKYKVYCGETLLVNEVNVGLINILLLGYIIDPFNPERDNETIIRNLAKKCGSKNELFNELQKLSGRFVLLFKSDNDFICTNDAFGSKQIYYVNSKEDFLITSSPKMYIDLIGKKKNISVSKLKIINSREFKKNEFEWYGTGYFDDRLNKVLPNHYLNINSMKTDRISISEGDIVSKENIADYTIIVLKGNLNAIIRRYKVIQALTAGWDSRTLLAASRDLRDNIDYFVFDHGLLDRNVMHFEKSDVEIPEKLSKKLHLNFKAVPLKELDNDFLKLYRKEHLEPRILPKIKEIQYQYQKYHCVPTVRISGIGGDLIRCINGYSMKEFKARELLIFTTYKNKFDYVNKEISLWHENSTGFSKKYNIPILDLFHWEQRLGNWGALYPFEQDIAIEEFWPFNNRNLILSLLRYDYKQRYAPHYLFSKNLILKMWKDVLSEPINPTSWIGRIKRYGNRSSRILYLKRRLLLKH